MLKSDEKVLVSRELVQQFEEINRALDKCCDLALQQPIPNKQIALMTDASFGAAGYAVLIEDDPSQKFTSIRKSYAPVAYGSKTFTPAQIKMSIYAKEFLAIYFAFKEFGHIFWGAPKPVIILTDNKAVTRFFQTKIIPPALWNACDYVIQFNFVIAHIPGAQNTAADYSLQCTGKLNLLKAQFCAFNTSDSTTIPLTVQNWQITSFVPDSTDFVVDSSNKCLAVRTVGMQRCPGFHKSVSFAK